MNYIGRRLRSRHLFFKDSNNALIVPIDHGFTLGPIKGLSDVREISSWINDDNISAIVAHKGMLENLLLNNAIHPATGIVVHMSGMPTMSKREDDKCLLTQLNTAVRMGADAVSVQLNYCEENFFRNMEILARVVDDSHDHGMPILLMLYDKTTSESSEQKLQKMKKLVRMAAEVGCDALKLGMPASSHEMAEILSARLASTKVFFAGGEYNGDVQALCEKTRDAITLGADGMCVGRNIFQTDNPRAVIGKMAETIRETAICINPPIMKFSSHSAMSQLV